MSLQIPYSSDHFPSGVIKNCDATLDVEWGDILWAAVTVGRPNRHYVFRHGDSSIYEAIFRWSLVRMSLEKVLDRRIPQLKRTEAAITLDPTEKGAVNYFLGMIFCKLFASKLLNIPYLLHLDVFRPLLNPVLSGRSRPDLIGESLDNKQWHAFECKGRVSPPTTETKHKAKDQAQRVQSVNGIECGLHIGAITYFKHDILHFYWCDPTPEDEKGMEIKLTEEVWQYYYGPILEIMNFKARELKIDRQSRTHLAIKELDLEIHIHQEILGYLLERQWSKVRQVASNAASFFKDEGYQPDGLRVKAGPSWELPLKEVFYQ